MRKNLAVWLVSAALSAPALGQNAKVDELVGEGVFGVAWTDTLDAVKARYPDGEQSQSEGGSLIDWTIEDGRAVFEVERGERDTIRFSYLGEALTGVMVTFPDCELATEALWKFLGPIDDIRSVQDVSAAASIGIAMPIDLGGWKGERALVRLTVVPGEGCTMTIGPATVAPAPATRSQLGLE